MNKHPKTEELHQEIVVDASPPEYRQPRWMVQIPVHPVVSVILAVVGSLIVLVTWSVWIIAHHQQFLDTSTILVYAAFISIGLWIAIRLIGQFTRHVIEPAIAAYHEWQIARGQKVKNKVLVTQPHYTVVNELTPDGKYEPKVYPIIQGRLTSPHSDDQALKQLSEPDENATLPTLVRYEDIRHLVPKGHTLLGVGEEQSLETRVFSVLDTCWICGGSKTGKTNTVSLFKGGRSIQSRPEVHCDRPAQVQA